jgi:hypothetical protein
MRASVDHLGDVVRPVAMTHGSARCRDRPCRDRSPNGKLANTNAISPRKPPGLQLRRFPRRFVRTAVQRPKPANKPTFANMSRMIQREQKRCPRHASLSPLRGPNATTTKAEGPSRWKVPGVELGDLDGVDCARKAKAVRERPGSRGLSPQDVDTHRMLRASACWRS